MTNDLSYKIEIEVYQGPFDLLLKAIDDGEIDIYKVSLSQIVVSYCEYWRREQPNLVSASDFLYMAAYLIELKTKSLLPAREDILAPEEQYSSIETSLLSHIEEYAAYKFVAQTLKERKEKYSRVYGRHEGEKHERTFELVDINLKDLVLAFQKIYNEAANRESFVPIEGEAITIEDRIEEIKHIIAGRQFGVRFEDIFLRKTRLEIVITFLAVLELAKQNYIRIGQDRHFASILIFEKGRIEYGNSTDSSEFASDDAADFGDDRAGTAAVQSA
ncbi:MAG: segregation/condensation protein A [Candidatus Margulisiibacteriota bacterium]